MASGPSTESDEAIAHELAAEEVLGAARHNQIATQAIEMMPSSRRQNLPPRARRAQPRLLRDDFQRIIVS